MNDISTIEYGWLKQAISKDASCGPNLEATDDDAFVDYYFDAEVRLPERYFTPGLKLDSGEGSEDRLFDPKSINFNKERQNIIALLERSRDIRLLSLLARFSILSGRAKEFADAIEGIAVLLEAYPSEAHPVLGKKAANRRVPLDDLGSGVTVGIPLQYLPINGDPSVTYRRYMVATGKTTARSGEEDVTLTHITEAISDSGAKDKVTKVHASLARAKQGIERIVIVCKSHEDVPFSPNISQTTTTISEIMALIEKMRPDLAGTIESQSKAKDASNSSDNPGKKSKPAKTNETHSISASIPNRVVAKAALQAVERYFVANEPSSAAVLLITQARLLIGRPLIEALETLLPEHSKNAVIDFGKGTGFVLSIDRLRSLSAETPPHTEGAEMQETATAPEINTQAEAAEQIRGVEDYYRKNEPTSPIPILLVRATTYLEKDFNAIVAELLPIPQKG